MRGCSGTGPVATRANDARKGEPWPWNTKNHRTAKDFIKSGVVTSRATVNYCLPPVNLGFEPLKSLVSDAEYIFTNAVNYRMRLDVKYTIRKFTAKNHRRNRTAQFQVKSKTLTAYFRLNIPRPSIYLVVTFHESMIVYVINSVTVKRKWPRRTLVERNWEEKMSKGDHGFWISLTGIDEQKRTAEAQLWLAMREECSIV